MSGNLTQFDPFGDLSRYEPFRGFDQFFKGFGWPISEPFSAIGHPIKMDVVETEDLYKIKAEIPGINKEDIKISVNGNKVSISAETKHDTEEKNGEAIVRRERYRGKHFRSFTLDQEVDEDNAAASYHDGILELLLPKKQRDGSRKQIAVN